MHKLCFGNILYFPLTFQYKIYMLSRMQVTLRKREVATKCSEIWQEFDLPIPTEVHFLSQSFCHAFMLFACIPTPGGAAIRAQEKCDTQNRLTNKSVERKVCKRQKALSHIHTPYKQVSWMGSRYYYTQSLQRNVKKWVNCPILLLRYLLFLYTACTTHYYYYYILRHRI